MYKGFIVASVLVCSVTPAISQMGVGGGLPSVSIGINVSSYPELIPVPGYPVYYSPGLDSNYFFYDGMYWDYQGDNWYASSWYNGPWVLVAPMDVPLFILRVPVRYYRQPPAYFRGWQSEAPPRWGDHWGGEWAQRRGGWDQWDHNSAPAPAPLPSYQKQYSGNRYPGVEQQRTLQSQNDRYQPRDPVVHKVYEAQRSATVPVSSQVGAPRTAQEMKSGSPGAQHSSAPPLVHQSAVTSAPTTPSAQPAKERSEGVQKGATAHTPMPTQGQPIQHPQQTAAEHQQPVAAQHREEPRPQSKPASQEPQRASGPREEKRPENAEERDQEHK